VNERDKAPTGEGGPSHLGIAKRLWRFARPQRWGLVVAAAVFFAGAATEPLIPLLLKVALDEGFIAEPSFPLWMVPVALIGLFALRGVLSFIGAYMLSRSSSRTVLSIRQALADVLLRAEAPIFTRLTPGVAVVKVVNDVQNVANGLSGALITLLRDGSTAIALLIYLFWQNWQLTLLSLVTVPVLGAVVRLVHKRIVSVGRAGYQAQLRLAAMVEDLARAWRVIRTFDAQAFERGRVETQARLVQRYTLKTAAASALMTPFSQLVSSIGVALIVTAALYQAQSGQGTVGSFVGYVTALLLLVSKTRHLTDISNPIINAMVVARGVFELMDTPGEPTGGTRPLQRARGEIELQDVSLTYPGAAQPALRDLSMHIPAGSSVALMGPSGSGKSTVVSVLLGFARPDAGRVLLDGVPLEHYRTADLRRQFAVVSQDIVLFDDTIAANVAYAQPVDEARVEACLRDASLWDHVATLPLGIQAPVGTNGSQLSGGQRQRLAIARALYKDAPIWVWDEATSALDAESEAAVLASLVAQHHQRTVIIIAHQQSAVRSADRVVVLAGA
jgi:subfamily B ATP-binding cassette protein MsbA